MIMAESVAFLPLVYPYCWIGVIAFSSSTFFHLANPGLVQSPKILFIVACDIFIYLEILKNQSEEKPEDKTKIVYEKITRKVVNLIKSTVNDLSDEEGWAFLGDVGSLLLKKKPNFDSRIYGFQKLTPLIKSIGKFDIEQRENTKSRHKLIFIRNKSKITRNS